jgi:predicted acetyltransferase
MPKFEIRPFSADEAGEVMYWSSSYAFHANPPFQDRTEWEERIRSRTGITLMGGFEDGRPASVAAASPMTQNVRGRLYPMAGVWGVSTYPQDRRKGYCRQVIARLLESCRGQGMALTGLYPFRESFYERMGYVTFPQTRQAEFSPADLQPLLKWKLPGSVELLTITEGYDLYRAYLVEMRQRTHGMAVFDNPTPTHLLPPKQWVAFAKDPAGKPVGVMLYNLQGQEITCFTLSAWRFYYDAPLGRYLLLEWISRHVDQAEKVELRYAPTETPETWQADFNPTCTTVRPVAMGRVLDVINLSGMAVGEGGFTVRLSDPLCPWNVGCWCFDGTGGVLLVTPAPQADCTLTIQALSALIYGTLDPGDFSYRGWGDPGGAEQTAMRRLFPPRVPHMHEFF